jgi:hypothetical protein
MTLRAALLTTVTLLLVAAPAHAAPRVLPAGAVFLGEHWVGLGDAHVVVTTDDAGHVIEHDDRRLTRWLTAPDGCSIGAAGGGRLLYHCSGAPEGRQRLTTTALDGSDPVTLDEPFSTGPENDAINEYRAVGATWMAADVFGYHFTNDVFVNWRTGAQRLITSFDAGTPRPDPAGLIIDLDAPEPFRPRCATLARRPNAVAPWTDFASMALLDSPPYGLVVTDSGSELWRCGARRPLMRVKWAPGTGVVLHAGWFGVAVGRRVSLIRLRDRRRFVADLPWAPTDMRFGAGVLYGYGSDGIEQVALPRR